MSTFSSLKEDFHNLEEEEQLVQPGFDKHLKDKPLQFFITRDNISLVHWAREPSATDWAFLVCVFIQANYVFIID